MKYVKTMSLVLVAVFSTMVAVSSAAAFELPAILTTTAGQTWKGANVGNTTLESTNGLSVACTKARGEGNVTAANGTLGAFHITFEGCTGKLGTITAKCTGLGDEAEKILVLGIYHSVIEKNSPELTAAILFLPEEVHYSCSALMLVKQKGSWLCLVLEPLSSKLSHEFHCLQKAGKMEEKKYFNDESKEVEVKLESSNNEGAFVEEALGMLFTIEFSSAVKFDD